jgi:hypothetical protein
MAKVIFYPGQLYRLLDDPDGPVGRDLKRRGTLVMAAAKGQVGVRTGALRASIHMRHLQDSRGQYVKIGSKKKYTYMHHEGTRPHIITPSRGHVLRFFSRGKLVFAHTVRHPGTKANRFLSDSLRLVR